MTRTILLPLALLALGCNPDTDKDEGDTTDTDLDTDSGDTDSGDTDDTNVACETTVSSVSVEDGAVDVYYRGSITVSFDGDAASDGATFTLVDATGAAVPFQTTWAEGNVMATLDMVGTPASAHTLSVSLCDVMTVVGFTTSGTGSPLTIDPAELVGDTFVFSFAQSTIVDPPFLDLLKGRFLTAPILLGVTSVDATNIDILGGLGTLNDRGEYRQLNLPTWDFPVADFAGQPYFQASTDVITIMYGDVAIPVHDFAFSGTFRADGSAIEEATAGGFCDTRYMGPALGQPDNPNAVCDFAEAAGIPCLPCADGEVYCVNVWAVDITAELVDGLTLVEVLDE